MQLLDKAIAIAKKAHIEQIDKAGKPYISHPLRVMEAMETESEKIVAILHDAVEDSELTIEDLNTAGFDNRIIRAIDAITKREGEELQVYLTRVMDNPLALKVKIADMTDNLDLSRISHPTDKDRARIKVYRENIIKLRQKLKTIESK